MTTDARFIGKRILILCPGVPHSRVGASTILFFHYIRGIAETGCRAMLLLLTDPSNLDESRLKEFLEETQDLPNLTTTVCRFDRLYRADRWLRPYVETLPLDVVAAAERFDPEVLVSFDVLCTDYARQIRTKAKRIAWLGDLNFQTFWYHALYDAGERPAAALRVPVVALSCFRWKRFYRRALSGVAGIIVASKSSEAALGRLGRPATYLPYPWPEKTRPHDAATGPPRIPSFIFFGALGGLGSRSAFRMLVRELYPRLVRSWGPGGFQLFLAGMKQPADWVQAAIQTKPEIKFEGFVEDLVSFMAHCHAVLVPIKVPVGNRSRILTALAHGALVIAHRNTALGNADLVSGENCLLAGSADEFLEHMRLAVEAPARAAAIAQKGRQVYERRFAPPVAVAALLELVALRGELRGAPLLHPAKSRGA